MPPRSRTVSLSSQMYCPSTRGTSMMKYCCPFSSVSHLPSGGSSTAPPGAGGWPTVPTPSTGLGAAAAGSLAGAALFCSCGSAGAAGFWEAGAAAMEAPVRAGAAGEQPAAARRAEARQNDNLIRTFNRQLLCIYILIRSNLVDKRRLEAAEEPQTREQYHKHRHGERQGSHPAGPAGDVEGAAVEVDQRGQRVPLQPRPEPLRHQPQRIDDRRQIK